MVISCILFSWGVFIFVPVLLSCLNRPFRCGGGCYSRFLWPPCTCVMCENLRRKKICIVEVRNGIEKGVAYSRNIRALRTILRGGREQKLIPLLIPTLSAIPCAQKVGTTSKSICEAKKNDSSEHSLPETFPSLPYPSGVS